MLQITRGIANTLTRMVFSQRACALHTSQAIQNKAAEASNEELLAEQDEADAAEASAKRDANDRTQVIPVETSIRYLKSSAYEQTYGKQFVWEQYRRNHKGMFAPRKTRKTCIRQGKISTGNPCPICRDEYLVLDHRNTNLLKQFISPQTGQVLSYSKTGLCQKQHLNLMVAVERAWDTGMLTFDVPFRKYDYSEYYGKQEKDDKKKSET